MLIEIVCFIAGILVHKNWNRIKTWIKGKLPIFSCPIKRSNSVDNTIDFESFKTKNCPTKGEK